VSALLAERLDEAEALFREAMKVDWQRVEARLGLARVLAGFGQRVQAGAELKRAAEIARRSPQGLMDVGRECSRLGDFEAAIGVYERAARESRKDGTLRALAQSRVAAAAERLLQLDRAEEWCEAALASDPGCAQATLTLGRIFRRRGDLERAERVLTASLDSTGEMHANLRAELCYERAAVRDAAGSFAGAMEDLRGAKAVLAGEARRWQGPGEEAMYTMRRLVQEMSPERVRRWACQSAGLGSERVAALVGFPRSGTTLLEQVLDAHASVVSVEETSYWGSFVVSGICRAADERASFARALDLVDASALVAIQRAYLDALRAHTGEKQPQTWLLDKNPIRTLMVPMLRRAVPCAPVIVALRDPRDVVLSNLMQPYEVGAMNVAFLDVERGAAQYEVVMSGWLKMRECLEGWVEVRYEDVVREVGASVKPALALLGLDWTPDLDQFQEASRQRVVKSPTYADVRQKVHGRAVRRWENYVEYLAPAMPMLDRMAVRLGYDA
jgi:tetratricopeptide (TPR) repeat protein